VAERWLLSLVLDADAGETSLRVFDADDLGTPAVASAVLPHAVPFGLHGNFVAA
jgi:carotenoid cleavage dioxygenase-like enzyme